LRTAAELLPACAAGLFPKNDVAARFQWQLRDALIAGTKSRGRIGIADPPPIFNLGLLKRSGIHFSSFFFAL
jgi:hypothetical protein